MSMSNTEKMVKDIRRKTRRKHSTEEKIRFVLEGLRGDQPGPGEAHLGTYGGVGQPEVFGDPVEGLATGIHK